MEDILNRLYRGEIHPEENYQPVSSELKEMRREFLKHRDALMRELDRQTGEKVVALLEERTLVSSYEIEDGYIQGMKLGAKMVFALLGYDQKA